MLTGPDLIAALKAAPQDATEAERIRLCGYVYKKDGRINRAGFYKALTAADPELSDLAGCNALPALPKDRLTFQTKIQAGGHAVIGAAYLRHLNAQPHQRLRITPSENAITLELLPV